MNTPINTNNAPAPIGPYNQSILAGNTLYISGQIALNITTNKLVLDNITAETRQVLDNLKAIVEAAGFTLKDIVKTSIFLNDMDNFTELNNVYSTYFSEQMAPARETVAVKALPKNVNVEISAIAVKS